jgi:flagellar protein FlgJ
LSEILFLILSWFAPLQQAGCGIEQKEIIIIYSKMKPEDFVKTFKGYAEATERKTGFPVVATLAQAAWESGWADHAPGNNFFGMKCSSWQGERQLLTTTEYCKTNKPDFPVVLKAVETKDGKYKCTVKDWFRSYSSPEGSFTDHACLITKNDRYKLCVGVRDWKEFVRLISMAGYATDPNYANNIISVGKMIEKYL